MTKDRLRLRDGDRLFVVHALAAYAAGKDLETVYDSWRISRSLLARPRGPRLRYMGKVDSREQMMADMKLWIEKERDALLISMRKRSAPQDQDTEGSATKPAEASSPP